MEVDRVVVLLDTADGALLANALELVRVLQYLLSHRYSMD